MSSHQAQAVFDIRRSAAFARRRLDGPANRVGRVIPVFEEKYCGDAALRDVLEHRFSFNGEKFELGRNIDWCSNPSRDVEWHILLHKFYHAPGLARQYSKTDDPRYRQCFEELVLTWIEQTPLGFIATDVTARRVQNWIYAWRLFWQHDSRCFSRQFQDEFLDSLTEQIDFVCANLAPRRNHRTLELYAIFLASVAISEMDRGGRWRNLSVSGMSQNIESDLLDDGVHCELSTDYHHIVLRSYLLFYRLAEMHDIEVPQQIIRKLCLALDFSMHVHRPDGDIPALSDSDSRSFLELLRWGSRAFGRQDYAFVASRGTAGEAPGEQHKVFADSGYVVLRSPWQNGERFADARFLAFDCGDIGAGNHGHIDALNIEVAAFGRPLIVDPGRYSYDEQGNYNWRAHFRKTSAHNTVTINRCDQAIYLRNGARRKIFNPRPVCQLVKQELYDDMAFLHGKVASPNYAALHHRHIWFVDNRYWIVLDRLFADEEHEYELRYQLTPAALGNVRCEQHDAGTVVDTPGLTMLIAQHSPSVTEEQAFVSKRYGVKEAAPRMRAQAVATDYSFLSLLYPLTSTPPQLGVQGKSKQSQISIDDHGRRDVWEWDCSKNTMLHRNRESVQSWRLEEDRSNG